MEDESFVSGRASNTPRVERLEVCTIRGGKFSIPFVSNTYDSEDLKLNAALVLDVEKGISIKRLEGSMRTRVTQQSCSIVLLGGHENEKLRQTRYWRNPPSITSIYDIRSCQK